MKSSTLYVAGLDRSIDEALLKGEFSKHVELERVTVIRDKQTRESKGFAYVVCKTPEDATSAMKEMDGRIMADKPIKVKYSFSETPEWVAVLENRRSGTGGRSDGYRGSRGGHDSNRGHFGPPVGRGRGGPPGGFRGHDASPRGRGGPFRGRGDSYRGADRGRSSSYRGVDHSHQGSDRGRGNSHRGRDGGYRDRMYEKSDIYDNDLPPRIRDGPAQYRENDMQQSHGLAGRGRSLPGRGRQAPPQDRGYLGYDSGLREEELGTRGGGILSRRRNPDLLDDRDYSSPGHVDGGRKRFADDDIDQLRGAPRRHYSLNGASRDLPDNRALNRSLDPYSRADEDLGYRPAPKKQFYEQDDIYGGPSHDPVDRLLLRRDRGSELNDTASRYSVPGEPYGRSSEVRRERPIDRFSAPERYGSDKLQIDQLGRADPYAPPRGSVESRFAAAPLQRDIPAARAYGSSAPRGYTY